MGEIIQRGGGGIGGGEKHRGGRGTNPDANEGAAKKVKLLLVGNCEWGTCWELKGGESQRANKGEKKTSRNQTVHKKYRDR